MTGNALVLAAYALVVATLARRSEGSSVAWAWMLAQIHPFSANSLITSITQSRQFHSAGLFVGGLV